MDLSSNDIRNYEFATQMRGYSKDEVDNLLDQVAAALDAVKQENLKLSMEVDSLKSQLSGLRQFEDTIKSAAIDARRNADMTLNNAKKEADLILSKAREEADRMIGSRTEKLAELEARISSAEMAKKSYLNKMRGVITSHLEIIDHLIKNEPLMQQSHEEESETEYGPMDDSDRIQVTSSDEVERRTMETIGTPSQSAEPIRTEEANEAGKIIEVSRDGQPPDETSEVKTDTEEDETSGPVDPELAEALENYQADGGEDDEKHDSMEPPPTEVASPAPGEIRETSSLAEDIPPEFIVAPNTDTSGSSPDEEAATDKLEVGDTPENKSDSDQPTPSGPPASPEELARELDKVVAKFEEEMDKAAHS